MTPNEQRARLDAIWWLIFWAASSILSQTLTSHAFMQVAYALLSVVAIVLVIVHGYRAQKARDECL